MILHSNYENGFDFQETSSDTESDEEDDDDEEDAKPEFESVSLKHFGGVNRIRVNNLFGNLCFYLFACCFSQQ